MILIERMVLLLLEAAPNHRLCTADVLSVLNVLNRRYRLEMANSLSHFEGILAELQFTYVDRTSTGIVLNPGGDAELVTIHQQQGAFCDKFGGIARNIFNRDLVARSVTYGPVPVSMQQHQLQAHV
jgi:hypothetical protein